MSPGSRALSEWSGSRQSRVPEGRNKYIAAVNPCFVGNGFPVEHVDCLRAAEASDIELEVASELCNEVFKNTKDVAGIWPQDHDENWTAWRRFRNQCLPKDYYSRVKH